MKTQKVGPITFKTPETAAEQRQLMASWERGRLDVGMAERLHPTDKRKPRKA